MAAEISRHRIEVAELEGIQREMEKELDGREGVQLQAREASSAYEKDMTELRLQLEKAKALKIESERVSHGENRDLSCEVLRLQGIINGNTTVIKSLEAELSTLGDALRKARQDIAVMERGRSTIRWNTDKVARMTMELARQTAAELKSRQSTSTLLKTHLDEARERADSGVDKAALLDAESIIRDLRTEVTKWEGLWTSSKARYTTLEADVKEKGEVITKYQQENWKEAYDELRSEYEADKSKFRIEIQEMEGIQREMLKDLDKKAESQKSTPHSKKISKMQAELDDWAKTWATAKERINELEMQALSDGQALDDASAENERLVQQMDELAAAAGMVEDPLDAGFERQGDV